MQVVVIYSTHVDSLHAICCNKDNCPNSLGITPVWRLFPIGRKSVSQTKPGGDGGGARGKGAIRSQSIVPTYIKNS